jgi:hypothetical protein
MTFGIDGRLLVAVASCDAGDTAAGGGFATAGDLVSSVGTGGEPPTAWQAAAIALVGEQTVLESHAVCLDAEPLRR